MGGLLLNLLSPARCRVMDCSTPLRRRINSASSTPVEQSLRPLASTVIWKSPVPLMPYFAGVYGNCYGNRYTLPLRAHQLLKRGVGTQQLKIDVPVQPSTKHPARPIPAKRTDMFQALGKCHAQEAHRLCLVPQQRGNAGRHTVLYP